MTAPPTTRATERPPTRLRSNRILFQIHGWLGLHLGLLLFVVCFSGALAVVGDEIDWLLTPAMRVSPRPAEDARIEWGRIYDSVRARYPGAAVPSIRVEPGSRSAAKVNIVTVDQENRLVYVHPLTGAVQGEASVVTAQFYLVRVHLLFSVVLAGDFDLLYLLGFALLVSAITGFLFYKNWLRRLFTLRLTRGGRMAASDLHRTVGIWTLIFTVILTITGLWYYFQGKALNYPGTAAWFLSPPVIPRDRLEAHGTEPVTFTPDRYIEAAKRTYPEFRPVRMILPTVSGRPVALYGRGEIPIVASSAARVYLDPQDGSIVQVNRSKDLVGGQWWVNVVGPVHFGAFGGISIKLLYLVLGIGLSVAILAGGCIWYLRVLRLRARSRWLWASVGVTAAAIGYIGYRSYGVMLEHGPILPGQIVPVGEAAVGPWRVAVSREATIYLGDRTTFLLRFVGPGSQVSFERASLWIGPTGDQPTDAAPVEGPWHRLRAAVPTPATLERDQSLWLVVEEWGGRRHLARFDVDQLTGSTVVVRGGVEFERGDVARAFPKASFGLILAIVACGLLTLGVLFGWAVSVARVTRSSARA
jgi:uncharacterized iron-regulated membrane protein